MGKNVSDCDIVHGTVPSGIIPAHLADAVMQRWLVFCRADVFPVFEEECYKALDEEKKFGTMNHYLTSKFSEELVVLPNDVLEHAMRNFTKEDYDCPGNKGYTRSYNAMKESFKKRMVEAREMWAKTYGAKTLHEQQQHRLFAAVKAAWAVEKKS